MKKPRIRLLPTVMVAVGAGLLMRVDPVYDAIETTYTVAAEAVRQIISPESENEYIDKVRNMARSEVVDLLAPSEPEKPVPPPAKTPDEPVISDARPQTQIAVNERSCGPDRDILAMVKEERDAIRKRIALIEDREAMAAAGETRVQQEIERLSALKETIENLIKARNQAENADIARLVTIYEEMKPKDAARIMNTLDLKTLLDVVERMAERKSAPIIAEMEVKKAGDLSRELATRRKISAAQARN